MYQRHSILSLKNKYQVKLDCLYSLISAVLVHLVRQIYAGTVLLSLAHQFQACLTISLSFPVEKGQRLGSDCFGGICCKRVGYLIQVSSSPAAFISSAFII